MKLLQSVCLHESARNSIERFPVNLIGNNMATKREKIKPNPGDSLDATIRGSSPAIRWRRTIIEARQKAEIINRRTEGPRR